MKLNSLTEAPLDERGKQMIDQIIQQLQAVRAAPDMTDHYDHINNLSKTLYNTDILHKQIRTLDASNAKNRIKIFFNQFAEKYPQLKPFFPFSSRSEPTITYPNLAAQNLTRANIARLGDPAHQQLFLQSVEANLPAYEKALQTIRQLDKHFSKANRYIDGINTKYMLNNAQLNVITIEYNGQCYDFKGRGKNPIVQISSPLVVQIGNGRGTIQFEDTSWGEMISALVKVELASRACGQFKGTNSSTAAMPSITRIGDNDIAFTVELEGRKPIQFTSNEFRTAQEVYRLIAAKLRHEVRPQAAQAV